MKTLTEKLREVASVEYVKFSISKNKNMIERFKSLESSLTKKGFNCIDAGEKPATGAAYSVIELSDRFRINYRCGYSRNNYAPCIEILK